MKNHFISWKRDREKVQLLLQALIHHLAEIFKINMNSERERERMFPEQKGIRLSGGNEGQSWEIRRMPMMKTEDRNREEEWLRILKLADKLSCINAISLFPESYESYIPESLLEDIIPIKQRTLCNHANEEERKKKEGASSEFKEFHSSPTEKCAPGQNQRCLSFKSGVDIVEGMLISLGLTGETEALNTLGGAKGFFWHSPLVKPCGRRAAGGRWRKEGVF